MPGAKITYTTPGALWYLKEIISHLLTCNTLSAHKDFFCAQMTQPSEILSLISLVSSSAAIKGPQQLDKSQSALDSCRAVATLRATLQFA